jgi:hypothetical protein
MRVGILLAVLFSYSLSFALETPIKIGGCKKNKNGIYSVCTV